MITVICPIYNEEEYILKCIDSILQQDYPKDQLEILFVDGISHDKTRDIINEYSLKYSFMRMLDNPNKIVSYAMNKGIEEAKGDVIIRLDAHASYPSNYFSYLVNNLYMLNADNVGVACHTDILNQTPTAKAIKVVLSNSFGVGNSYFRTGITEIKEVDTVPFGCFRKDVFERFGMYNTKLVRNQDIELNKRIKKNGGRIILLPDITCTYYARETFKLMMKNNYNNGYWNILTLYYTKTLSSLSVRHFVPLFFVLSVIFPIILSFIWSPLIIISMFSILLYLSVLFIVIKDIRREEKISIFLLFRSFLGLHFSYGLGSLMAFIRLPFE